MSRSARGFTLVEVAVALALLAIALTAVSRAMHSALETGSALRQRALAQWVAENRIAERISTRAWLAPGRYQGTEVQANIPFRWRETVSNTPHPWLRRLDVSVTVGDDPGEIASIVGFIAYQGDR